ncbi:Endocytosis/signaling protein [Klebsormidium nitens]|uniref:Endocytosis/signaling protein n=1 Tax=Klebsormidium nitens TaxID=105231 RepID=A0A1Y1IH22_KLENI|nr:Endocytosis/signaling protein [Klebsormidium nitens]|eukprot:GAQ88779.1 Endocytosis/signaling protein [Klebsormidium nitens]
MDLIVAPSSAKRDDALYRQWFDAADADRDGRLTGSEAVSFFSMSQLPREVLKKVWGIADVSRAGYLGFREFVTAMQVIGLAQAGYEVTPDILKHKDPEDISPPVLTGIETLFQRNLSFSNAAEVPGSSSSPGSAGPPGSARESSDASWTPPSSVKPRKRKPLPPQAVNSVIDGLKRLYVEKIKPLEETYLFGPFHSPPLTPSDFDSKPMVMLLGQYSTGKTTFIKHLLKREYPGAHIGPEPTTDRFVAIMQGQDERSVPGNTVAVQADMPFNGLTKFGTAFLSKFECSQLPHQLLDHVTFIDTPGVLSGEKQRTMRSYDFTGVVQWFAQRSDLILLLFDPHKLDISDEFKRVIGALRGQDDKIRVVLNKADQVETQQLMRVYGALMWSLGKVLNTPEVSRVYIGSFNDRPMRAENTPLGAQLFEAEQNDLMADLNDIPRKSVDRKVNEFVKRARAAKIHAYIVSSLRARMPFMGKAKVQQQIIDNLEEEFDKIQREHHLPRGDFPNVDYFREVLQGYQISNFNKLNPKLLKNVDDVLGIDIPDLLHKFRNPYD